MESEAEQVAEAGVVSLVVVRLGMTRDKGSTTIGGVILIPGSRDHPYEGDEWVLAGIPVEPGSEVDLTAGTLFSRLRKHLELYTTKIICHYHHNGD